jgi:hypothetical protein
VLEQEPKRTATGVTRVREWRDGVPAQANLRGEPTLTERKEQAEGWPGRAVSRKDGRKQRDNERSGVFRRMGI